MNKVFVVAAVIAVSSICGIIAQVPQCPPPPQNETILYPHPNCSLYWECDNGNAIERSCPDSLYFNPALNRCDFAWNVTDCVGGTRPPVGTTPMPTTTTTTRPPTTTQTTTTTPTTTQPTTTTTRTTTQPTTTTTSLPHPVCPETGIGNLHYPGNCSLYYLCWNGRQIVAECATGSLFDPVDCHCRSSGQVNCAAPSQCSVSLDFTGI